MNGVRSATATQAATQRVPRRTAISFYVGIAMLMTVMVLVGFWRSYFGSLFQGTGEHPWVFHFHAAVFMGWMFLLISQTALVSVKRTKLHRKVGAVGIGYGASVFIVGLIMPYYADSRHIAAGEMNIDQAATFLLLPLGDMVLFAGFFAAAIIYRRSIEIHKRLMLFATVALVFAAFARLFPLLEIANHQQTPWTFLALWLAPVLLGMGYDAVTRHRVHPAYLIGTCILIVAFCRVYVMQSSLWISVGRMLLAPIIRTAV